VRSNRVERVDDRLGGERGPGRVGQRGEVAGWQRRAAGIRHGADEPGDGLGRVADEDVPERGAGGLVGVSGDCPQLGAVGQVVALGELVVPEDGRAEGDDHVVAFEVAGHRRDRGGEDAAALLP
jgi:hypothetical protein